MLKMILVGVQHKRSTRPLGTVAYDLSFVGVRLCRI